MPSLRSFSCVMLPMVTTTGLQNASRALKHPPRHLRSHAALGLPHSSNRTFTVLVMARVTQLGLGQCTSTHRAWANDSGASIHERHGWGDWTACNLQTFVDRVMHVAGSGKERYLGARTVRYASGACISMASCVTDVRAIKECTLPPKSIRQQQEPCRESFLRRVREVMCSSPLAGKAGTPCAAAGAPGAP